MVTANNSVVNREPPTEALHDRSKCQRCQTPRLARLDRSKPDSSTDGVAELVRHAGQPNPPMVDGGLFCCVLSNLSVWGIQSRRGIFCIRFTVRVCMCMEWASLSLSYRYLSLAYHEALSGASFCQRRFKLTVTGVKLLSASNSVSRVSAPIVRAMNACWLPRLEPAPCFGT
jgi:hypothetical protein